MICKKTVRLVSLFLVLELVLGSVVFAQQTVSVRLKDVSRIIEARDNQLLGFGLVVGLRNSGDSRATGFTQVALRNLLGKLGISVGGSDFNSRNVAAVMVTSTLPPFMKKGQRISVIVSALGDCSSLAGGMLLLTPLQGADMRTYAVAQGAVIVSGVSETTATAKLFKDQATVGNIPGGAIIEEEVPVTFSDQHNITVVMNESNFITVARAARAVQEAGFPGAKAVDANTVKIPLSDLDSSDLVTTIAVLENVLLVPDSSSKIVVNARTGTVVIGEMVRLLPVALTHGSVSIKITDQTANALQQGETQSPIQVQENDSRIIYLNPSATLSSLVDSLNEIGVTPKDLISIIQALKESGALIADIDVI